MSVTKTISLDNIFIFKEYEKSLTMDSVRDVFLDQFNECEETRSLGDLFTFKESGKSLTMDSKPFSEFSLLSPKKYKSYRGELSR